ncbi:SirB2 family protein [Arsukibacterium sp.]|uniref:SirB2 family protein n=1 Tax=Arsukibacterium sp. TaxID=1977258 RepID=UPI003565686C
MAFKSLHLLLAVLSVSLLFIRFGMMLRSSPMLQHKLLKIGPHVVDTLLILSAVVLMLSIKQYPLVDSWLTEKVIALLAYIALAVMALRGRTMSIRWLCFLGALGWLGLMVRVALDKQPVFIPL